MPIAYINPIILDNNLLSSPRPSSKTLSYKEEINLVSISEISSILPSTFDNILLAKKPR